jgi:excisionase family DNA binding protein
MDTEAFLKEQIITTEEATDILALSKQRISQLAASGDLPFLKHISSGFLFLKQDVQEYKRIRSGSAIVWNGTNGCGWLPITERKKLFVDCIDAHGHPVAIELYATSMDAIARFRIPHRDIRPGAQNYTDTKPTCVIEFQDGHTLLADFCSLHTLEKHPFMVSFIQEITGMQVIFSEMKKNRFYTATYDAEAYLPGWRWVDHPSRFPVSATTPFHDGYFFTFQSDGKTIHAVQKAFAKFDYRVDIVIDQLSGLLETIRNMST